MITIREYQGVGIKEFATKRALKQGRMIRNEVDENVIVNAEINQNRWIAKCLWCHGAEMVDKTDKRFFCLSCFNKTIDGKWARVVLPDNIDEIEEVLNERPEKNRNWTNETIKKLKEENKKYLKDVV